MKKSMKSLPGTVRHDWTLQEIEELYASSLPDLVFYAQQALRAHHDPNKVQMCALLSIKTGGCPENCGYCSQSTHHGAASAGTALMDTEEVLRRAAQAKADGANRICMGAAWREVQDGPDFERVLDMVRRISAMGLETCCTLGMLTQRQAERLAEAGLVSYNHNLDTSPEYYANIVSTRTYEDRLPTLAHVRKAGISVCCGGIIGMGESLRDRLRLLQELSSQTPHPDSVPINMLVRVKGTPLAEAREVDPFELVRMFALTRILIPKAYVRISAGRAELSREVQALCFLAGANSVFSGEKLLTTPNPCSDEDRELFKALKLSAGPKR
ncbi:MAG: biotin synthase BioB [Elusimicrobia bacterium RIFOXYA12_FULL_51_18]|nr:MAG: biotin synthase BioB [Elusimicrobia bacterium RIFOXYA12_FULL_51_18]OGS32250.1 MAG: biotin synthase BioB [Elusimicrobia bacterium RIFOXYA2_FULL_53_38]